MSDSADKIIANIEHLSGNIADSVERALLREMKRVQADAKRLAPVDKGQLRNSITADVEKKSDGDIIGTVGTNLAHAMYNEFGTGPVGKASPKFEPPGIKLEYRKDAWGPFYSQKLGGFRFTRGQPARPFLYPAFKQNQSRIKENIAKAIKQAMKGDGGSD